MLKIKEKNFTITLVCIACYSLLNLLMIPSGTLKTTIAACIFLISIAICFIAKKVGYGKKQAVILIVISYINLCLTSFRVLFISVGLLTACAMYADSVAVIVCGLWFCSMMEKQGQTMNNYWRFLLFTACGATIGGYLLHGITNINQFYLFASIKSLDEFVTVAKTVFNGFVFYGGFIGGVVGGVLSVKFLRLDKALYMDTVAVIIPLAQCIGRFGCFTHGCCYGIESEFGITLNADWLPKEVNGISRFPVQLLESAFTLIIFCAILHLYNKKKLQGKLFYCYVGAYAIVRFFIEFLRGDAIRGFIFGLSTSQFISAIMLSVVIFIFTREKQKAQVNLQETQLALNSDVNCGQE